MKTVNKSSKTVAEYNANNKEAIELGLIEAWEVSAAVLEQEKKAAKEQAEAEELAVKKTAVLARLGSRDGKTVSGVEVEIAPLMTGGDSWRSGYQTGWKLWIGRRYSDNKKWAKIGDGVKLFITDAQVRTVLTKVAEVGTIQNARTERENKQNNDLARYQAFVATPEGLDLVKGLTNSNYVSDYGTSNLTVNANGTLTYNYETFTVAQWQEIVALRRAQAVAMKALKETFAAASKKQAA
jgi:hypothetical protein